MSQLDEAIALGNEACSKAEAAQAEIDRLRGLMFEQGLCGGEREGLKGIICHDCELWAGYCRVDGWEPGE